MAVVAAAVVVLAGAAQVTLLSRFNGVGYTFVLAGFLKIMTVGGLTLSAPTDVARTAFGKATPYLMVPVGLGLCWIAKQVCVQPQGDAQGPSSGMSCSQTLPCAQAPPCGGVDKHPMFLPLSPNLCVLCRWLTQG